MITNFEEITKPLTDDEILYVNWFAVSFKNMKKEEPVKTDRIVEFANSKRYLREIKTKLTPARLRKIINHINGNAMLCVIGTSKGYYVSEDEDDIEKSIKSKRERANAINFGADGQQEYLNKKRFI